MISLSISFFEVEDDDKILPIIACWLTKSFIYEREM